MSFREDEMNLYHWMEDQWGSDGDYRSRSAVILAALKLLKEQKEDEEVETYT